MAWAIIHPVGCLSRLGKKPQAWMVLIGVLIFGGLPFLLLLVMSLWQVERITSQPLAPGDAARVAQMLARAAPRLPWRRDLWEKAGQLAYQGGDFPGAVEALQRAADLRALSPRGYLTLGDALKQTGDLPGALAAWQEARAKGEATPEIYARLLEAHRSTQDYEAAIADLQAWINLEPTEATLHYQLGLLLATQEPEAARVHLTRAAELDPSYASQVQKLLEHLRAGLLSDDPAYALYEAGRALGAMQEWELAARAFEQALQKNPDFADAWAFLGEARQHLEFTNGDRSALSALEKALNLDTASLTANTLMALYWQRQGQYARALEYLQTAADLYPQNAAVQAEIGRTLALEGRLEEAWKAYQKALELAPQDATYYRLLALFSLEHDYHVSQVALPAARQAVVLAPGDPQALDTLGQVLLSLGDLNSAQRFFLRALDLDPDFVAAHLHLGVVYSLQGDWLAARREWERVIALDPDSSYAEQARRLLKNAFP